MQKLFPTHFIVALAELTEDDVWEDGREFDKGSEWTIDANSSAYVWRNQMSDNLPDHVLAVKYKGKTLRDIRSIYWHLITLQQQKLQQRLLLGAEIFEYYLIH